MPTAWHILPAGSRELVGDGCGRGAGTDFFWLGRRQVLVVLFRVIADGTSSCGGMH